MNTNAVPTSDNIQFIQECLQTATKEDLVTIATSLVVAGIESQDISVDEEMTASISAIRCAHSGDSFKDFIEGH